MKFNPMVCFLSKEKVYFSRYFIFLGQFQMHSKIECKVRRVPLYTVPPCISCWVSYRGTEFFKNRCTCFFLLQMVQWKIFGIPKVLCLKYSHSLIICNHERDNSTSNLKITSVWLYDVLLLECPFWVYQTCFSLSLLFKLFGFF